MLCVRKRVQTILLLIGVGMLIVLIHSMLVAPVASNAIAASTECADGIDNDFDGHIDYPQDPQCLSLHDQSEGPTGKGLFLDITDGLKTVKSNGHMTYTINLNSDRDENRNIDVQFFIPHQTNLISSTGGGDKIGDYVVWRNVTVYPERTRKLYVNVGIKPQAQQDLLVVSKVYSEGEEATDITRIEGIEGDNGEVHQLKISVNDGKAYAEPMEKLTYRIVVDNTNGPGRVYRLRTDLPVFLNYVNGSGEPRVDRSIVEWANQKISADEIQEFYLTATVDRDAPNNSAIQLKIASGPSIARDTTSVYAGTLGSTLSTSISDGLESAVSGEYVAYDVNVRNESNKLATEVDVNVALPRYMEYVSSTEGGEWVGKNVRWIGLTVSPHGNRKLRVTARIRSDAELGSSMRATAEIEGNIAVDKTFVSDRRIVGGGGIALTPAITATSLRAPVLLRKVADRSEVRPGDTVSYDIYLRNNTDRPFGNVVIQDKLDTRHMQVLGSSNGRIQGDRLSWSIPSLAPGEEWTVRYTARVNSHVPHGIAINNIVSVSGEGIETFSLNERVYTSNMNVITSLPPSGVGFGGIFVSLTGLLGAAQTAFLRRRRRLFV